MRKIYFCHDRVKSSADPHPAKPEKVFGKTFKTSGNGSNFSKMDLKLESKSYFP